RVAPRTETEEIVAAIWSEALEVPLVGVHDHFFELGGHSLRAMMVVSRLRKALGKSVPVRLLFENPVLESFCAVLQQARLDDGSEATQPIVKTPRVDPLPASSFQERVWFNYMHRKEGAAVNHYMPFRLRGHLNVPALERSLTEIIRRHEVLRTRVRMEEDSAVQVIAPAVPLQLEIIPMKVVPAQSEELLNWITQIVQTSLDEGTGPLVRFVLVRWSPVAHLFLIVFHPLAYDASVRRILFRELELLYAANSEDRQLSLPEPALQYADLAMWQRRWLLQESPARRMLVDFWTRRLEGDLRPVALPFARSSPVPACPEKGIAGVTLHRATVSNMARFAREQGATQFMFLLACAKVILHLRTGQTDILVGTYFAGVSRPELDDVMGPQTNLVTLRTDLSGNPSFVDVLKRVREVVLEAQAHQDLPFEQVCSALHGMGRPSPPIEAIFMHTHIERRLIRLTGVHGCVSRALPQQVPWGLTFNFVSLDNDSGFLKGRCVFDPNLYEPTAVRAMLEAFPGLIEKMMANALVPLDDLAAVA
ncbi:MAG TPA: condensation domain-containing protein, partial [Candidatus Saccharimonadia bacterium]|nr:condensation domain-containing protein [Candidatus Saccharimonadia bacterium]